MERLNIKGNVRERFCKEDDNCPLKHVFAMGQQKSKTEGSISLNEVKELCVSQGLIPKNDYYGSALPQKIREKVGAVIFTADCTKGAIEGTNYTNCGSILATIESYHPASSAEELAINLIRAQWILNNGP